MFVFKTELCKISFQLKQEECDAFKQQTWINVLNFNNWKFNEM
jgi:hypothetical protein